MIVGVVDNNSNIPFEPFNVRLSRLIDAGETLEQSALRELKEETGYVGDVMHVSPGITSWLEYIFPISRSWRT